MSTDGRAAELLVERWLRARGLSCERFSPHRRRLGKTPDFRVATPAGTAFYVEVKTLNSARPGHGALALKLVRARAQFDAVNQGGRLANVLALVVPAPSAVVRTLRDLAAREAGPVAALDLVLGFSTAGAEVANLYLRAGSRHTALVRELADARPLGRTA